MNEQIRKFVDTLQLETEVSFEIDEPSHADGEWWIDLVIDGMRSNVLWKASLGFGIFTGESVYGGRPQEIYRDSPEASARILQLAASWKRDAKLTALGLKGLRHLVGATQLGLADALGTDQARISRMENGDDMKLSTLVDYLGAMGGTLELRAHFPSFEAPIEPLVSSSAKGRTRHAAQSRRAARA